MKDPTTLKLVRYFYFYSASKNTSFGFSSCSELLQLKFVEINFAQKCAIGQLQGWLTWKIKDILCRSSFILLHPSEISALFLTNIKCILTLRNIVTCYSFDFFEYFFPKKYFVNSTFKTKIEFQIRMLESFF